MKYIRASLFGIALFSIVTSGFAQTATAPAPATPPPPPPPPPSIWSSSVALGLTMTRGNSDTTTATGDVKADRKTVSDELILDLNGTFGENNGIRNAEAADANAQYNLLTPGRLYYGLKVDAMSDVIARINYRLTLAPLVGYYLIKETNTSLAVEAGPAVVLQKLGDNVAHGYATLRFAERFEYHFTATTKLWEFVEYYPQVDYWKNYYINSEIGVESALTTRFSLRAYLDDQYYNIPAPGRLKNDAKIVVAIAYKLL